MNIPRSASQLSYKALSINNIPLSLELNLMTVVWKLDFFYFFLFKKKYIKYCFLKKNRSSKEDNQFGANESNDKNTWTLVADNKFFKKCTKLGKKPLSCLLKIK